MAATSNTCNPRVLSQEYRELRSKSKLLFKHGKCEESLKHLNEETIAYARKQIADGVNETA